MEDPGHKKQLLRSGGGAPIPDPPPANYGLLYNYFAYTDARGLSLPDGFRIAAWTELNALDTSFGAGALKSTRKVGDGDPYWTSPNGDNATNASGMNMQAAGDRLNASFNFFRSGFRIGGDAFGVHADWLVANFGFGVQFIGRNPAMGFSLMGVSDSDPGSAVVADAQGRAYTVVNAAGYYWLGEYIRTTFFGNGDPLTDGNIAGWNSIGSGAWCWPGLFAQPDIFTF